MDPSTPQDDDRGRAPVLSEKDLDFIEALQIAPRIPTQLLAEILDESPTTIARRLSRLTSSQIIRVVGRYAVPLVSRHEPLHVYVKCAPGEASAVGRRLLLIPDIQFLMTTTGSHDLFATVYPLDGSDIDALIGEIIPRTSGVVGVETRLVLEQTRLGLSWRLRRLSADRVAALDTHRTAVTGEPPSSIAELGPLELEALTLLGVNARTSAAELSRRTGTSNSTAYRTITALLSSGALWPRLEIEPALVGYPIDALIEVQTPPGSIRQLTGALGRHPSTRDVAIVTGPAPVSYYGVFADPSDLARFITDDLSAGGNVSAVETAIGVEVLRRYWIDRDGLLLGQAVPGLLRPGAPGRGSHSPDRATRLATAGR